jgi:hypothetical protein
LFCILKEHTPILIISMNNSAVSNEDVGLIKPEYSNVKTVEIM